MLQAPAGQPPDVSARLRRACDMAAAADSSGGSHNAEAPTGDCRADQQSRDTS